MINLNYYAMFMITYAALRNNTDLQVRVIPFNHISIIDFTMTLLVFIIIYIYSGHHEACLVTMYTYVIYVSSVVIHSLVYFAGLLLHKGVKLTGCSGGYFGNQGHWKIPALTHKPDHLRN
mgnify:CR=1 FL=1